MNHYMTVIIFISIVLVLLTAVTIVVALVTKRRRKCDGVLLISEKGWGINMNIDIDSIKKREYILLKVSNTDGPVFVEEEEHDIWPKE